MTDISLISQVITVVTSQNRILTQDEERQTRQFYLEFIEKKKNPIPLLEIANELRREVDLRRFADIASKQSNDDSYQIKIDERLLDFENRATFTIGRLASCDVKFPNDTTVSRLHAIIFLTEKHVLVVDVGSLHGIQTVARSKSQNLDHSYPNARRVLVFGRDEVFQLQLGDQKITFSPKICLICMTNPRQCVTKCMHYAMCLQCCSQLKQRNRNICCPICRQINTNSQIKVRNAVQTCVM